VVDAFGCVSVLWVVEALIAKGSSLIIRKKAIVRRLRKVLPILLTLIVIVF
jgi:hypothetical protein